MILNIRGKNVKTENVVAIITGSEKFIFMHVFAVLISR